MCSFLFNPREYRGLQGDDIGSTWIVLSRTYDALITYLSRTYHALISRKNMKFFLFLTVLYTKYIILGRWRKIVKKRGAPKRPSVGSRKDAREMHNAVSGRAAMLLADYSAGSVVAYTVFDDDELAVLDGLEGLEFVSGVVDSGSRRLIS